MKLADECKEECKYAKDVGCPEYACDDECQALPQPCPHCFESSGYESKYIAATWTDPAWEDTDYTRPCKYCDGTGTYQPAGTPVDPPIPDLDDIAF